MIYHGDCLEILKTLPDNSVDAVITDPPYGLSFMGKKWDYDVPSQEIWEEALRVLKPGGYLLSFAGTRTQHRMAVRIEDAGFEIRDMIMYVYGSGFPKSLSIGKAVDKLQGNEREDYEADIAYPDSDCWGIPNRNSKGTKGMFLDAGKVSANGKVKRSRGTSEWEGWGTALKPALEPITVARKPLEKGLTVAENCLKWGVGGINIDGCRVGTENRINSGGRTGKNPFQSEDKNLNGENNFKIEVSGRFPANLIHDGSDEVVGLFPNTKSGGSAGMRQRKAVNTWGGVPQNYPKETSLPPSDGSAARFFYCAKASKAERNRGCEGLEAIRHADRIIDDGVGGSNPRNRTNTPKQNFHPTVKPIALMEYLVKLVTREGQTVLDPFAGSGTTGIACKNLNREAILIEREAEYVQIAECRIAVNQ